MEKINSDIYDFHFIMDKNMKNKLKNLDPYVRSGNLSQLIVKILLHLSSKIEMEHFFGEQRKSKYKHVHNNLKIKRECMHVYMPEYLYRRLKMLHQDLNFYSIAQLVRFFLRYYLRLVKKYGKNIKNKLISLKRNWKKINEKKQFSLKSMLQLLHLNQKNSLKIRLINIYNDYFSPFCIYRL